MVENSGVSSFSLPITYRYSLLCDSQNYVYSRNNMCKRTHSPVNIFYKEFNAQREVGDGENYFIKYIV